MEREQEELQFLGIGGIFVEAQKMILAWRRIFAKIAVSLIVPLSVIFLLHVEISDRMFAKIDRNEQALEEAPEGSLREERLIDRLASEWASYAAFKAVYLVVVLVLSLLSTSAVVYTVACVYTAKEMTFRKVLTVVPKVWRRLVVTFLWSFAVLFAYNAVALLVLVPTLLLVGTGAGGVAFLLVFVPAYLAGLVYVSVIWHLASVISVLEERYGLAAMEKSKELVKGKAIVACAIFLVFHVGFVGIEVLFRKMVARGRGHGDAARAGFGLVLLLLMSLLVLEALVVQTVVYFVCKSFHHESIDKSSLADHLEVFLGEYIPLKASDIQLEHFRL
ncbi:uncharacterized protein LOC144705176 [Wolffia australiana]